jgi:hypothetical protein
VRASRAYCQVRAKDEPGRKKFDKNGETYSERWANVDDLVLLTGATRLGLLNKKAGKALEMINWMRNHASPAHAPVARAQARISTGPDIRDNDYTDATWLLNDARLVILEN